MFEDTCKCVSQSCISFWANVRAAADKMLTPRLQSFSCSNRLTWPTTAIPVLHVFIIYLTEHARCLRDICVELLTQLCTFTPQSFRSPTSQPQASAVQRLAAPVAELLTKTADFLLWLDSNKSHLQLQVGCNENMSGYMFSITDLTHAERVRERERERVIHPCLRIK